MSTVAANLRDCAPFASQLPPTLPEETRERWRALYRRGLEALAAGVLDGLGASEELVLTLVSIGVALILGIAHEDAGKAGLREAR